jgi:tRNA (guanine10-N2)-methyltransferase
MEYLIRFAQCHENFRKPEIQALATLVGADIEFLSYNDHVSDELSEHCT